MPTPNAPTGKPTLPEVVELLRELQGLRQNLGDDAARHDWIARKNALLARFAAAEPRAARRIGLPTD